MQNTVITFNLISKLLVGSHLPITELVPPSPLMQWEQFDKIVCLPKETLAKVPYQKAKTAYEEMQFEDTWSQQVEQKPFSWLGMIMEMLNGKLIDMEEKLYSSLKDKYKATVDEVDQATFRQFFSIGQWVATTCGPYICSRLVEGAFISLNDQGNYNQVTEFAYAHMWQVSHQLLGHRLFVFGLQDYDALVSLRKSMQQQVDSDQEMLKIW